MPVDPYLINYDYEELGEGLASQRPHHVDTSLFCKDCIHSVPTGVVLPVTGCIAQGVGWLDAVTGDPVPRKAGEERADEAGACGPTGKLFEAKPAP